MNLVALRNTCTLFRDTIEMSCRLQLDTIQIAKGSDNDQARESLRRLCTLTDNHPLESSGPDLFRMDQINFKLIGFRHAELIRMLGRLARDSKRTIININSGWIVDGLIIARSNHRVIQGGSNLGGSSHFFVLQQDEFITNIEGANCYFQNTRICGRIAIATNKRRIGPFGHAGNPDGSDQHLTYRTFSMSMVEFGDIQLQSVGYRNQYLGQVISQ